MNESKNYGIYAYVFNNGFHNISVHRYRHLIKCATPLCAQIMLETFEMPSKLAWKNDKSSTNVNINIIFIHCGLPQLLHKARKLLHDLYSVNSLPLPHKKKKKEKNWNSNRQNRTSTARSVWLLTLNQLSLITTKSSQGYWIILCERKPLS
jgi:hypothetical protein